jgi:tRNA pseudouridine55 synthase
MVATENSTKLIPLLEGEKKEYITTIVLDGRSDSLDTETPIVAIDTSHMLEKTDKEICDFLLKEKTQTPPKYSAIHV